MTSAATNIVTALVSALQASPPLVPNVYRARVRPISGATAINVIPQGSTIEPETIAGAGLMHSTTVSIEVYSLATTQAPDLEIDPLVVAAFNRVMQDTTLGGTVLNIEPQSVSPQFDTDEQKTTCVTMVFAIEHDTKNNSLEA